VAAEVVAVQLTVPVSPELLHWVIAWRPPAALGPAGVAVQVVVGAPCTGLHWLIVESAAALAGAPLMLLVMVAVQVRVLAPPAADRLHWWISVTGDVAVVVAATPLTLVTIVDAVVDDPSAL